VLDHPCAGLSSQQDTLLGSKKHTFNTEQLRSQTRRLHPPACLVARERGGLEREVRRTLRRTGPCTAWLLRGDGC
jgi:hypothetical protein